MAEDAALEGLLRRVARRVSLQRALDGVSSMAILSGAWLMVVALLLKLERWTPEDLPWFLAMAFAWPAAAVVVVLLRPVHPMVAAQIIDRRLGTKDRFGSAWQFLQQGPSERSRYETVEITDACRRAPTITVAPAMPLRWPRRLLVVPAQVVFAFALLAVPILPTPGAAPSAAAPPPGAKGIAVNLDDLEGFNRFLQDVHQDAENQELDQVGAAAEEFNRLIQDLADQELPYREAMERIAALEQKLHRNLEPIDRDALDYLEKIGQDLTKASLTEPAGKALQEPKLAKARDRLREAAERAKTAPPDRRRLEELRRALAKAAKRRPPRDDSAGGQQKRSRLKKKGSGPQDGAKKRRRLKKKGRDLERLHRDVEQQRERQRQLERLQRDLQKAAEGLNLQGDPNVDQLLEQLGEDLNQMAREQSTEEQTQAMQRRLEELRRLLHQLQRGGKSFQKRLGRFAKGARGGGKNGTKGQPGAKAGAKGSALQISPSGQGRQIARAKQGANKRLASSPGEGSEAGQGSSKAGLEEPTKLNGRYTDVELNPAGGEGPSKSQVIDTAADQGFTSKGYGKVHQTFERHAETVLEKQDIPSGYRHYIRQYFERIRPR